MTYEDIFERLEGMVVVEVAEAKGGGLAILLRDKYFTVGMSKVGGGDPIRGDDDVPEGPTILVVGGDNETMCVQSEGVSDEVDWKTFWDNVRV